MFDERIFVYDVKLYINGKCVAEATAEAWNVDEAQRIVEKHYGVKATSAIIRRL